jgi:acyl-CoA thioester hydrolase
VYYGNYLRFFEAGRAELLRAAEIPYATFIAEHGIYMPVVESWVRHYAPSRYDDDLLVSSWVHEVRAASFVVAHRIDLGDTLVAAGGARLACVSTEGSPRRVPAALRAFDPVARRESGRSDG